MGPQRGHWTGAQRGGCWDGEARPWGVGAGTVSGSGRSPGGVRACGPPALRASLLPGATPASQPTASLQHSGTSKAFS